MYTSFFDELHLLTMVKVCQFLTPEDVNLLLESLSPKYRNYLISNPDFVNQVLFHKIKPIPNTKTNLPKIHQRSYESILGQIEQNPEPDLTVYQPTMNLSQAQFNQHATTYERIRNDIKFEQLLQRDVNGMKHHDSVDGYMDLRLPVQPDSLSICTPNDYVNIEQVNYEDPLFCQGSFVYSINKQLITNPMVHKYEGKYPDDNMVPRYQKPSRSLTEEADWKDKLTGWITGYKKYKKMPITEEEYQQMFNEWNRNEWLHEANISQLGHRKPKYETDPNKTYAEHLKDFDRYNPESYELH